MNKFTEKIYSEVESEYTRLKEQCTTVGEIKKAIEGYAYLGKQHSIGFAIESTMNEMLEHDISTSQTILNKENKQPDRSKSKLFTRALYLIAGSITGIIAAKIVSYLLHVLLG